MQNRVSQAASSLPAIVNQGGITIQKQNPNFVLIVDLTSPDGSVDPVELSNYAYLQIVDPIKRLPGVGNVQIFGERRYSMRIWLRPDKLAQYNLTPADIAAVVREQNQQFAAGRFGEEPTTRAQAFTYSVTTPPRLFDRTQFEDIIIRSEENGGALRLKDVARVELGALTYGFSGTFNGAPAVPIGVYLHPVPNALEVAATVRETMANIAKRFPVGLRYDIPFDTTRFVEVSIEEVAITFVEAIALVVLVVFLFLQSVRAMIIPIIAIPVSIIGTFAGMYLLGFSINLLTLFALVLAIGIVVDNAIVVVEAVSEDERGTHASDAGYTGGHERDQRRAGGHYARDVRRIHTGCLFVRPGWRILPAVLADARHRHRDLRHQRSNVNACTVRHHAQT